MSRVFVVKSMRFNQDGERRGEKVLGVFTTYDKLLEGVEYALDLVRASGTFGEVTRDRDAETDGDARCYEAWAKDNSKARIYIRAEGFDANEIAPYI